MDGTAPLTGAKLAAFNRKANKANGTTGTASAGNSSATITDRAIGLDLQLHIVTDGPFLTMRFRARNDQGETFRSGLANSEYALPDLEWQGWSSSAGEMEGFTQALYVRDRSTSFALEQALPIMKRSDKFLALARDESEDLSFAYVASCLASHFRATSVKAIAQDGTVTEYKRGAAYVAAHRASEAFLVTERAKLAAEQAAKQANDIALANATGFASADLT